jgi:hypothetical protein
MAKRPPKKRKQNSLNDTPSRPKGVRRPSEAGVGREGRRRSTDRPPSSTRL